MNVNQPTEPEAMQWTRADWTQGDRGWRREILAEDAERIVAWVNSNGGEAKYEPPDRGWRDLPTSARIAVRTPDGWDYAKPGWYVVMGHDEFDVFEEDVAICVFHPCDPETYERRRASEMASSAAGLAGGQPVPPPDADTEEPGPKSTGAEQGGKGCGPTCRLTALSNYCECQGWCL